MTTKISYQLALILILIICSIFSNAKLALSYQGLDTYTRLQIDSHNRVTCMDSIIQADRIETASLGMLSDYNISNNELTSKASATAAIIGSLKNLAFTIHEMKKFKELYEQEAFNDILQDLVDQGLIPAAELNKRIAQLSLIYSKIKSYNALMDSIEVNYNLYEDQNKQLHAKVSSIFSNFTIISHQYFKDDNLEGEIIFKAKKVHAVVRNFSLVEINNQNITANYNIILELLRNDGFEITSNTSSAGLSDVKIVIRNTCEDEAKTEKKSDVVFQQDNVSQKTAANKTVKESLPNSKKQKDQKTTANKKQKKETVTHKSNTQKVIMTYAKTKDFISSNLPLLKRIFKEHVSPAAIRLLKNDTVMAFAIRHSYYFLPPQVTVILSQEMYVAGCMASRKMIINYVT